MRRSLLFLIGTLLTLSLLFSGCNKELESSLIEADLYGQWAGEFILDTLGNVAHLTADINQDYSFHLSSDTLLQPIDGMWQIEGEALKIAVPNEEDKILPTTLSGDTLRITAEGVPILLLRVTTTPAQLTD